MLRSGLSTFQTAGEQIELAKVSLFRAGRCCAPELGQVVLAFLNSPEYVGRGDKAFVDSMYQTLLGRGFNASEEAYWLGQLGDDANGKPVGKPTLTHLQVASDFLFSTESFGRLVHGYYQVFLQRQTDSVGLNGWVAALQQGLPFWSVGEGFLTSNEFYTKAAANK